MAITSDKFSNALNNLICIKPKVIFLTGKSGVGKSYFSNKLKESGYKYLELDILIKKLAKKHKIGIAPDYAEAFSVYKNTGNEKLKNDLVKDIHKFIESCDGPVIIDGAISSPDLINKIFAGKHKVFTFTYLYPVSATKYAERLIERLKVDIESGKKTVAVWGEMKDPNLITLKSLKTKEIKKLIRSFAKIMIKKSNERFASFKDSGFSIYKVIV